MKLEVRDLGVSYGATPVVRDLNFTLDGDDILMLVGPTGCGKTTILQAVAGLVPIECGQIQLGDRRIGAADHVPPEKRHIGMVFQDFALFPHLSVAQNVGFRLSNQAPVNHWLNRLGLEPLREARPERLSGGQKQRVALARALAHEPSLMLLDEPLSSLDASLKDVVRWEIRDALKEAGVPAIWVTHDQAEALSVGDQVGVLNAGRLQQVAPPEHCFGRPANRFVAGFLGEASFVPGQFGGGIVKTALGSAPAMMADSDVATEVDLLVRPDDLELTQASASQGQGEISWSRYEGGTRLYRVALDEGGSVRVRVNHEQSLPPGQRVVLRINATEPLTAFPRA